MDMAFIDAEEFLFAEGAKNLIKEIAKDVDKEKVLSMTKKICPILEGNSRIDAFVTLYNLIHSMTAKISFYDNKFKLNQKK